ncbi:peptidase inhibitor family I36 protein [Kitasatospora sp. NPDC047058]|uniref:peptidase inhibitor family I36 protein n=1 Tax=Kitasatospora sp. NPDC047058 TaxID=3155620 RepID=UPI0034067695
MEVLLGCAGIPTLVGPGPRAAGARPTTRPGRAERGARGLRTALIGGLAALASAAVLALPTAAHASARAWMCTEGNVCAYSGPDGMGKVCAWPLDDPDWQRSTGSS